MTDTSTKGTAPRSAPQMVVPVASFDFLAGGFRAARKERGANTVVVAVAIVALLISGGLGLKWHLDASSARSSAAGDTLQNARLNQEISGAGARGAVGPSAMQKYDSTIATQASGILSTVANADDLIKTIFATAQTTGVTVSSVNIPSLGSGASASSAPATTVPPSSPNAAASGSATVTITASAKSYSDVSAWEIAVDKLALMTAVTTNFSGSAGSITISTTGSLSKSEASPRAAQLKSALTPSAR